MSTPKRTADPPDPTEEAQQKKIKVEALDAEALKKENIKLKHTLTQYEAIFLSNLAGQKPTPVLIKSEWEKKLAQQTKLKKQLNDLKLHESALITRLTAKEQELNQLQAEVQDLKKSLIPTAQPDARNMMLDPTVNMLFARMKDQLTETNKKLKDCQEDIAAHSFSRESPAGLRLVHRIRFLQNENEDLGRKLAEENTHKLEIELQAQRDLALEYGKQLAENDDVVEQLLDTLESETEREVINKQ